MNTYLHRIISVLLSFFLVFCCAICLNTSNSFAESTASGRTGYAYVLDENGDKIKDENGDYLVKTDIIEWEVSDDVLSFKFKYNFANLEVGYTLGPAYIEEGKNGAAYPWNKYKDVVKTIEIGSKVPYLPKWMFAEFTKVKSVVIRQGVKSIAYGAFAYCGSIQYVFYSGSVNSWNSININRGKLDNGNTGIDFNKNLVNAVIHYKATTHDWIVSSSSQPTCEASGRTSYKCIICGETNSEIVPPLGHSYGDPSYTWSSDYSTATANMICKNDSDHVVSETAQTISIVTKEPTYTEKGETTYTATFNNEAFSTQTTTVANIDKLPQLTNPMAVKANAKTIKYSVLKKKAQTIPAKKAFTVKSAQGKVTYKKTSGNAKITVSSTGKVKVKKGLKKSTYKVKVKVTAAGTDKYKSGSKVVTLTIKVK